jgi:DNA-binding transcriptional MerR regulator
VLLSLRGDSKVRSRQAQLLHEVRLADRLADLEFTVGQVCRIADVTKMQLDYWTVRGAIATRGRKQRLYDARACETVMLIKQARDLGFDVSAAIAAARDFQAHREPGAGQTGARLAA